MTYTDNYNLKKPESSDFYNIDDFNDNADILDAAVKEIADQVDDLEDEVATKSDAISPVSGSGDITVTVEDNKMYTYTGVTSLTMTGANVSCLGVITFGTSPTVTVSGFTAMDGDDITQAAAGEAWEFNVLNGRCLWKKWG